MTKVEYNGWTNYETWNLNLMYESFFQSFASEQRFKDESALAEALESAIEEIELEQLNENSLAHFAVSEYLDQINWQEIAKHYIE